jgi:hypothetical protein
MTWCLWQRLLWKEWRLSWPLPAAGLVLLLAVVVLKRQSEVIFALGLMLLAIAVLLVAASRVLDKGMARPDGLGTLPLARPIAWIAVYLLPGIAPLLVGALVGVAMCGARHYSEGHHGNFESLAENPQLVAPAMALFFLALFLVSTLFTRASSLVLAVIGGLLWLFYGLLSNFEMLHEATGLFGVCTAGCLGASLVWEWCAAHQRYILGRVLLGVVLLGACLPLVPWSAVLGDIEQPEAREHDFAGSSVTTADTLLECRSFFDRQNRMGRLTVINCWTHELMDKELDAGEIVHPLCWLDADRVLVIRQRPEADKATLQEWEYHTDRWETRGTVDLERDGLTRMRMVMPAPDGRYALVQLTSRAGLGLDIWLLNLQTASASLVLADVGCRLSWEYQSFLHLASWQPARVFLSGGHPGFVIDLPSGRAYPLVGTLSGRALR